MKSLFRSEPLRLAAAVTLALLLGAVFCIASEACDCPGGNDEATFSFGSATLVSGGGGSGSVYSVPLLVSMQESATFTQLTVAFDPELVLYVEESATVGGDVGGSSSITEFPNTTYVTFQVVGTYTDCDQEVAVAEFQRVESSPGPLGWIETEGGPNSYCHVNYTQHHGLDGKITPTDICFVDGAAKATRGPDTATKPSQWGAVKQLFR